MMPTKTDKWRNLSSYIYDYIFENNLEWPCMACRWGPIVDKTEDYIKQKIYFSCRTDGTYSESENLWRKFAGFLVVAVIDIPNTGVVFDQELNHIFLQQNFKKCPYLTVKQILVHPGEINVLKKSNIDPKWIATHTDSPTIFVWNLDKHMHVPSKKENLTAETPELRLVGHTEIAPYALDWAKTHNRIGSGGKDKTVLIWDIEDYQTNLSSNTILFNKRELNAINNTEKFTNVKIQPRRDFVGHTDAVEDVCFHPKNKEILISVGDDKRILQWDTRSEAAAFEISGMHADDIHTVDWNLIDENLLLTGSGDGAAIVIDLRTRKELFKTSITTKSNGVRCCQFSPFNKNVFAIGAEQIFIFDLERSLKNKTADPIFQHGGHKNGVTDFDWNPHNPWSLLSSSDNCDENSAGGGSLHAFRPLDLVYLPEDDAFKRLETYL